MYQENQLTLRYYRLAARYLWQFMKSQYLVTMVVPLDNSMQGNHHTKTNCCLTVQGLLH